MNYDEFDKLCRENGTTPTALSLKLGLSKGNASSWKRGGNPSADILLKISDELNCTVDALLRPIDKIARTPQNAKNCLKKLNTPLMTDDEENLLKSYRAVSATSKLLIVERAKALAELEAAQAAKDAIKIKPIEEPQDDEEEPLYLDMYDMPVSAGRGACIDYAKAETIQVPRTYETEQANYMVRISGDSMEPRFEDGDVVLVKAVPTVDKGDIGIFVVNGQAYIKELGENELISLNPKYDNIPLLENDSGYCQGKVIGIVDIKK